MPFIIFIFLAIVQLILFVLHYAVYKSVIVFGGISSVTALQVIRASFFVVSLSFLAMTIVTRFAYNSFTIFGYRLSAIVLGTLYFFLWGSLLAWLVYGISKATGINTPMPLVFWSLIGVCLLISVYGLFNSYRTQIVNLEIPIRDLPSDWQGKKIVFIADTHYGQVRTVKSSRKIAKLIAEQKPEAVLIAGDFYDGPKTDFYENAKPFAEIPSALGTFFVTGNHEEYANQEAYKDGIQRAGVKNIDDQILDLNGLQLVGLGYENTMTREATKNLLIQMKVDWSKPTIVLKHVPKDVDLPAHFGARLQLYGHSHNGQVYPYNLLAKIAYKGFHYGLKPAGEGLVYTTSGVGTWGPPQRVGTKSEIVVIHFK